MLPRWIFSNSAHSKRFFPYFCEHEPGLVFQVISGEKKGALFRCLKSGFNLDVMAEIAEDPNIKREDLKNLSEFKQKLAEGSREEVIKALEKMSSLSLSEMSAASSQPKNSDIEATVEGDDSVSSKEDAEKYRKLGEYWAPVFYGRLGYSVSESSDSYDLDCLKGDESLRVEVKVIDPHRPNIRLTRNKWEQMTTDEDTYELLIITHIKEQPEDFIRVRKAWATLWAVLWVAICNLQEQPKTDCRYDSNKIEFLIGLQLNQGESRNDILLNWRRLLKECEHEHIEQYSFDAETHTFQRKP